MADQKYCSNCGGKTTYGLIENWHRVHCTHCGAIHYENPKPTATLLCQKLDELMLVRRAVAPAKGAWSLPGGFMELGETPDETAVRELKEETNLDGKVDGFIGYCSHHNTVFGDVLLLGLKMKIDDYTHMQAGDDAAEVGFFSMDNLPPLAFRCHEILVQMYRDRIKEEVR